MGTKRFIFINRFLIDPNAHGGSRRDAQIYEILSNFDLKTKEKIINPTEYNCGLNNAKNKMIPMVLVGKLIELLKMKAAFTTEYKYWDKEFRDEIFKRKKTAYNLISIIKNQSDVGIVMIDDPIYFYPLLKYLKKNNITVIANAHNFESLVPGNIVLSKQKGLLKNELEVLSSCDLVITISREERYLLNNLGINSVFFQYYPANGNVHKLKRLREMRKNTNKKNIMLLGSAGNKPTLFGMTKAIEEWQKYQLSENFGNLIIGGYGTEKLKTHCKGKGIRLIGSIDESHLFTILSEISAILCYQEKGSGALTRIIEMLIGNVPVLANRHSARSSYGLKGIFEFTSFGELKEAEKIDQFIKEKIPIPGPPDSSMLVSSIKKLIGNKNNI